MARGRSAEDAATLQMALVGYQMEKQRIESAIQDIQRRLKGAHSAAPAAAGAPPAGRRELSPAARARIAAAQKRRWAAHRKQKAQAAKGGRNSSPKVAAAS